MDCILYDIGKVIWKSAPIIVPLLVLLLGVKYDRRKRKTERREKAINDLIITCDKLIKYAVHYEYRALAMRYIEAQLPAAKNRPILENLLRDTYNETELAGHNFYLCKSDLIKSKYEMNLLWEGDDKNKLLDLIDIVLVENVNRYEDKYTQITWDKNLLSTLKTLYEKDSKHIETLFYKSKLGNALYAILNIVSPEILSHLKGTLSQINKDKKTPE